MKKWTQTDINSLIVLVELKKPYKEICKLFDRTIDSVQGKIKLLRKSGEFDKILNQMKQQQLIPQNKTQQSLPITKTIPMNKITYKSLQEIVIEIINGYHKALSTFSAYDVTQQIRARSNAGLIHINGLGLSTTNNTGQEISHNEVKEEVKSLMQNNDKFTSSFNGEFVEYTPVEDDIEIDDEEDSEETLMDHLTESLFDGDHLRGKYFATNTNDNSENPKTTFISQNGQSAFNSIDDIRDAMKTLTADIRLHPLIDKIIDEELDDYFVVYQIR